MALMAAKGIIEPYPDACIFADTQAEPDAVAEHLEWLKTELPFPIYIVSKGCNKNYDISSNGTKRETEVVDMEKNLNYIGYQGT